MSTQIAGITLAGNHLLLIMLSCVGMCALIWYRAAWQRKILALLAGSGITRNFRNVSSRVQLFRSLAMMGAAFFLCCALLRPQWGDRQEIVKQEGRNVLIALDISRSMLATDCEPNRLECAKQKIRQLLASLSCERVGLILFSGSAFMQCPLTADFATFRSFLDQVDVETISSGTTAVDQALQVALSTFESMGEQKSKLLVVLTDGEDFSSNLKQYKDTAQKQKLTVFTIGIGTAEGAPIPLYDRSGNQVGHQRDSKGAVVISRLNEGILETLAQDAGGEYLPITQDATDVQTLVRRVQAFEKEQLDDELHVSKKDQYQHFLLLSFICFALEWLL